MALAREVYLKPGQLYRTGDFAAWTSNAPRLAKRLVSRGELVQVAHGLYVHPRHTKFGNAMPGDRELMAAFLDGAPFVFTGSERWNALGLGTTAVFATPLVYNTKYSKEVVLGGKRFHLRRVKWPTDDPSPEWSVVDLLENAEMAGADRDDVATAAARAVERGRFDRAKLWQAARRYGTYRSRDALRLAMGAQP